MPMMKKYYEKKGELNRYREIMNEWKDRYRKKTGSGKYPPRPYEPYEDKMILEHSISDRELSKTIHRSVMAIQIRRSRLKSENY